LSRFQIIQACRKDQNGAVALEFAIVGSILITAILGAIELGLLFWTRNALEMTAAMTARCAALRSSSCADPKAYAQALAGSMVTANILKNGTVTVTTPSSCYTTSTAYTGYTQVTISTSFWGNVLVGPLPGTTVTVSACYVNPA
jgi:Flp pilus assembly protein TadG